MMLIKITLPVLLVVASNPSPTDFAYGQMRYSGHIRYLSVSASGECERDRDNLEFSQAGSFDAVLSTAAQDVVGELCQSSGRATASQSTELEATRIGGVGAASGSGVFAGGGNGLSGIDVEFVIESPTPYSLTGEINGGISGAQGEWFPSEARVLLESNGIPIHAAAQNSAYEKLSFDFAGQLTSGTYRLVVEAKAGASVNAAAESSFAFNFVVPSLNGDFDKSGVLDVADIDLLSQEVRQGENDLVFDLNHDFLVNGDDRVVWIRDIRRTWLGDSNLDGEFNSADLVAVFRAGEFENDVVNSSSWSTGDWDGDGSVGSSDLVAAFQSGGFELGPRDISAVPEPTRGTSVFFASLVFYMAFLKRNE